MFVSNDLEYTHNINEKHLWMRGGESFIVEIEKGLQLAMIQEYLILPDRCVLASFEFFRSNVKRKTASDRII